jgi:hypothetical protein
MSLTLIEAIAGQPRAAAVARQLGATRWDLRHDSGAFALTRPLALSVFTNVVAFWKHEELGLELSPHVDEVSLALVGDAWSRTYRSRAVTFAAAEHVESRNGIRFVPDRLAAEWPADHQLPAVGQREPFQALDDALTAIRHRYGSHTASVVAMQLEYPGRDAP